METIILCSFINYLNVLFPRRLRRLNAPASQCVDTGDEVNLDDLCVRWKSIKNLRDQAVSTNQLSDSISSLIATAIGEFDKLGRDVCECDESCDDPVILSGCGQYTYPLWFLVSLEITEILCIFLTNFNNLFINYDCFIADCGIGEASPDHCLRIGQPARLLRNLGRLQETVLWLYELEIAEAAETKHHAGPEF